MRVSCGWQPLFEYLFCCKQRPSKFRKTGFFKTVKATSCSSNAASNTFQLDSKLQAMSHYSVLSSQWIVNWAIWYMFTRCLNKEWQTWELGIPTNQEKPAHLCLVFDSYKKSIRLKTRGTKGNLAQQPHKFEAILHFSRYHNFFVSHCHKGSTDWISLSQNTGAHQFLASDCVVAWHSQMLSRVVISTS